MAITTMCNDRDYISELIRNITEVQNAKRFSNGQFPFNLLALIELIAIIISRRMLISLMTKEAMTTLFHTWKKDIRATFSYKSEEKPEATMVCLTGK